MRSWYLHSQADTPYNSLHPRQDMISGKSWLCIVDMLTCAYCHIVGLLHGWKFSRFLFETQISKIFFPTFDGMCQSPKKRNYALHIQIDRNFLKEKICESEKICENFPPAKPLSGFRGRGEGGRGKLPPLTHQLSPPPRISMSNTLMWPRPHFN